MIILIDKNIWRCYSKCYSVLYFKRGIVATPFQNIEIEKLLDEFLVCLISKIGFRAPRTESNDIFAFVFLSSSLFLFYFVFSDATDSITQSQSLSDSRAQTWSLKMEALSWGSSVQEIPLTVTWEFGTTISQLERLFG